MKTQNKTTEKISQIRDYLIANYRNEIFCWKDIEEFVTTDLCIHPMTFYSIVYSGCVDKISRGTYRINNNLLIKTPYEIYKESVKVLNSFRLKNKKKPQIEIKTEKYNEQDCVSFLKNKGYKIMKPIYQFEEI